MSVVIPLWATADCESKAIADFESGYRVCHFCHSVFLQTVKVTTMSLPLPHNGLLQSVKVVLQNSCYTKVGFCRL